MLSIADADLSQWRIFNRKTRSFRHYIGKNWPISGNFRLKKPLFSLIIKNCPILLFLMTSENILQKKLCLNTQDSLKSSFFDNKRPKNTCFRRCREFFSKQMLNHLDIEYLTEAIGRSATMSAKITLFLANLG